MNQETYYDTLRVEKTASHEIIRTSYEKLLKSAKSQLLNSPLYATRQKKLQDAYQILSNPELRQAYDRKISPPPKPLQTAQTRKIAAPETIPVAKESSFSFSFSKSFIVLIALILVLLIFLPRSRDTTALRMANLQMQRAYEMQSQQFIRELELRTQIADSGNFMDNLTPEQIEAAETQRLEIENKKVLLWEQSARANRRQNEYYSEVREAREARQAEASLKRKQERERRNDEKRKRSEEYAAQKRSREFIKSTNRTTELIKKNERLKLGYD